MGKVDPRSALSQSKRIVVKIGSRALMADRNRFESLAAQVMALRELGKEVLVVSSGAVAAGRERLGFVQRPTELARLQAAAAAGQSLLMRTYEDAFEARGVHIAQVLLTHGDLSETERSVNVQRTFDALFVLDVIPIVNENDAVAVEELTFGDNDRLATMVATLIGADLLVMLTDVQGVLDGEGNRVSVVNDVEEIEAFIKKPTDDIGLGGMSSKVEAAKQATIRGVPTVIGSAGQGDFLKRLVDGDDVGTLFVVNGNEGLVKEHWVP